MKVLLLTIGLFFSGISLAEPGDKCTADFSCDWDEFCHIGEYDYEGMRQKMVGTDGGLYRDLMENRFHPRNVHKFESWGFESVY